MTERQCETVYTEECRPMTQRLNEQVYYCELKEAAALDKEAKTHLEEELRVELEEKQHVINTLNTKVALLKNQEPVNLVDIEHHSDLENGARVNGAFQNSDDKLK